MPAQIGKKRSATASLGAAIPAAALTLAILVPGPIFAVESPSAQPSPSGVSSLPQSLPTGFAPSDRTGFAPILKLTSPGAGRAERATELFDRQLAFERKLLFHPETSELINVLVEKLPPRQSTLIRAPSYYSRMDIPWTVLPDGTHQVCFAGSPDPTGYYFTATQSFKRPNEPFNLAACFALRPPPGAKPDATLDSVTAGFAGELLTNTFGLGRLVDAAAAALRDTYGDLQPPWDIAPGQFNDHDRAASARFRRDLPILDERLHHYLAFDNILDEFDGAGGPWVLFNLRARVKQDSLRPFEHLYRFYSRIGRTLSVEFAVTDSRGHSWLRAGFDRGRVSIIFMVRNGMLTPFDSRYRPAGESIALDKIEHGVNLSRVSVRMTRLGMKFGLEGVSFTNHFTRAEDSVRSESLMNAIPQIVAPIGVHKIADLVAGRFLRALALDDGGLRASLASEQLSDGTVRFASAFSGRFLYSPTLEILARVADAIAGANDAAVRADERRLGEELFDAFVKDYNHARPGILALDRNPELTQ